MFSQIDSKAACGALCMLLPASFAYGHGGGGDIALTVTNGQVDIGFAVLDDNDITQEEFFPDDNVFQAVFTPLPTSAFYQWEIGSSEPGFDADENQLPVGEEVTFNVESIRYWDGEGPVSFSPAPGVTAGYQYFGTYAADASGFHEHPMFGLDGPVVDGVYLTEMTVSVNTLLDSESFYLVGLVDQVLTDIYDAEPTVAEQVAAAANAAETLGELTRNYLADPLAGAPMLEGVDFTYYAEAIQFAEAIPEPSSAAMLAATLALAAWRRR